MTRKGYHIQEVTAGSPAQARLESVGYTVDCIRTKHGVRIAVMTKPVKPRHPLPEFIGSGGHLWSI